MKKILFALSIATSAALISSCTKQNQEEIPGIELNTTCTATLSQNSFDQIGVRHNEILDSVQVSYNDLYDVDRNKIHEADTNKDGTVSWKEHKVHLKKTQPNSKPCK